MANNNTDPLEEFDEHQEHVEESLLNKNEESKETQKEISEPGFIKWLKEDWLLKLGALFIILSVGWFIGYAAQVGWLGPVSLVSLGLLFGLFVSGFGFWLMRTRTSQGAVLNVLGTLIIVLTVWGAQAQVAMFPNWVALGIMFLSLVATAVASVTYTVYWMSVVSLIAGMFLPDFAMPAPELVDSAQQIREQPLLLFAYYLVLVLGTLWTVVITRWRSLTLIALILVGLNSFGYWVVNAQGELQQNESIILAIGFLLVLSFFVTNTANIIQNQENRSVADLISAGLNGLFLLGWVLSDLVADSWESLALLAWAVIFVAGASGIARRVGNNLPIIVYGAVAIMLLGVATAVQFDGPALKIAFTMEIAGLVIASYPLLKNIKITEGFALLFAVPMGLSLPHFFAEEWGSSFWHEDFAVLAILMFALLLTGMYIKGLRETVATSEEEFPIANILLIFGSLYFFALVWLVTHSITALAGGFDTGLSLAIYAISGLTLYILGDTKGFPEFRVYGAILFGGVILRLLLVEVWEMSVLPRIATFFFLGLVFIGVALVWKQKKESQTESEHEQTKVDPDESNE